MFLFITLNKHTHYFHELGELMRFIFPDFINEGIQYSYKTSIVLLCMRNVHQTC